MWQVEHYHLLVRRRQTMDSETWKGEITLARWFRDLLRKTENCQSVVRYFRNA